MPGPHNGSEQTVARLERTGEALGQAKQVKLDHVQVQMGNVHGGVLRAEVVEEQERKLVCQGMEMTDEGDVTLREYVHTERIFYRRVFEIMYIAASNEPEDPEDQEQTKKEKCIDCCFQSISCNVSAMMNFVLCKKSKEDDNKEPKTLSAVKKVKHMSAILRRGRSNGSIMHAKIIFPLVRKSFRYVWVVGQCVVLFVSLVFSLVSLFPLGENRIFDVLHVVLAGVGFPLALIDTGILFAGCILTKCCKHKVSAEATPNIKGKNDSDCTQSCEKCLDHTRNVFDIIRMIISGLLFYPILICDIFEMITSETYIFDNTLDGISFIGFALSLASQLFFVYIVRIAILIAANYYSQKQRVPNEEIRDQCEEFDPSISKSARYFQCYFVFHVCAQMVAQILMFIAIAAAIRVENEHLFSTVRMDGNGNGNITNTTRITNVTPNNTRPITTEMPSMDESIHVSNQLWYMLVAGYILPICGILSFFIVTYFWVQEFPMGICVDVVSGLLRRPGVTDMRKISQPDKEELEKQNKIRKYIHLAELKKQFRDFRDTPWFSKFVYPFYSPQTVLLSIIYAVLQGVFVIFALRILGSSSAWATFCVVAGFIGYIANLYVFTVAVFWIMVFIFILLVIAVTIQIFVCLCILCVVAHSGSNDNQNRRQNY